VTAPEEEERELTTEDTEGTEDRKRSGSNGSGIARPSAGRDNPRPERNRGKQIRHSGAKDTVARETTGAIDRAPEPQARSGPVSLSDSASGSFSVLSVSSVVNLLPRIHTRADSAAGRTM